MGTINQIKKFFKLLENHHLKEYAIQCAYYVILSFIPFIILLFSLIQFTNIKTNLVFFIAENLIPGNIYDFVEGIMKEASFKSIGTLSLSGIILIWSAGQGFFALCKGFHYIYETPQEYNYLYLKLKSIICILFFIVLIVGVLLLIAFGENIIDLAKTCRVSFINFILTWRIIWQWLILFLVFWLMYKYVPNHKVKLVTQIPGAIFSAISWYSLSFLFSIYLTIFKNFSIIYGSLTSIILLMIWVYWCMYAILVGAEINVWIDERNKKKKRDT
ncbi:MAG: YihY/virulence factor BrkB family protein [Bacteroidetes bacterium]|nr:YihY/virulence factor BrkB family protein [Bacteroidota bacterium]